MSEAGGCGRCETGVDSLQWTLFNHVGLKEGFVLWLRRVCRRVREGVSQGGREGGREGGRMNGKERERVREAGTVRVKSDAPASVNRGF